MADMSGAGSKPSLQGGNDLADSRVLREALPCDGIMSPGRRSMPKRQHVAGVGPKEQRMYEHIKEDALKEGRYKGREEEVAARTVLKKHKEEGHAKGQ